MLFPEEQPDASRHSARPIHELQMHPNSAKTEECRSTATESVLQLQSLPVTRTVESFQILDRPYSWTESRVLPICAISIATFFLHGYHPYVEDASIYVAGIERQIDASLFVSDAAFVDGHTKLSVFSHFMAAIVHHLHLPLDLLLLLTYFVSIAAFLSACHLLAGRIFASQSARWSATLLAAACFTLPAAATSLLLMDPYVTARSISTPLSLFAIIACLDRAWPRLAVFTVLTVAMHPLMGFYLVDFLLIFILLDQHQSKAAIGICAGVFVFCGLITLISVHSTISTAYREAALSRTYYFLSNWRWYEVMGLLAPMALMSLAALRAGSRSLVGKLCTACVLVGATACLVSLCFVHPAHPDLLMRLQVLRSFHTIYVLGLVMLGGCLGSYLWARGSWMAVTFLLLISVGMFTSDPKLCPASAHIDWPGSATDNPWRQAFLWIHANTPPDAIFAADPHIFGNTGEHSLGFRAISERGILTDVKDEGVASLFPSIAPAWSQLVAAQQNLDHLDDGLRVERLRRYRVTWLLLSPNAETAFSCPYRNSDVAVCRLNHSRSR